MEIYAGQNRETISPFKSPQKSPSKPAIPEVKKKEKKLPSLGLEPRAFREYVHFSESLLFLPAGRRGSQLNECKPDTLPLRHDGLMQMGFLFWYLKIIRRGGSEVSLVWLGVLYRFYYWSVYYSRNTRSTTPWWFITTTVISSLTHIYRLVTLHCILVYRHALCSDLEPHAHLHKLLVYTSPVISNHAQAASHCTVTSSRTPHKAASHPQ